MFHLLNLMGFVATIEVEKSLLGHKFTFLRFEKHLQI